MSVDDGETTMLGDFRPGYTLWQKKSRDLTVIIIQGEGGDLLSQDVEDGFTIIKKVICECEKYATFYDLTEGMLNLWPQAPALLSFAAECREIAAQRQVCTIAVCPDERVRNWVRWILGLASKGISYYIVQTTAEGWKYLDSDPSSVTADVFGEEATLPLTLASGSAPLSWDTTSLLAL